MLLVKNGKLIALDENDQKLIFQLFEAGGTRIMYYHSCMSGLSSLMVVDVHGNEVGSLAGESVSIINQLTHLSELNNGIKLSEFIDNYCPLYRNSNHSSK